MITARFKKTTAGLDKLDRRMPGAANDMARRLAEETRDHIRENWSTFAPSSPGQRPAVVSGELDSGIDVVQTGMFLFRSGWAVKVNPIHGKYLEEGTSKMAARPYLARSAMYVGNNLLKSEAKKVISIR